MHSHAWNQPSRSIPFLVGFCASSSVGSSSVMILGRLMTPRYVLRASVCDEAEWRKIVHDRGRLEEGTNVRRKNQTKRTHAWVSTSHSFTRPTLCDFYRFYLQVGSTRRSRGGQRSEKDGLGWNENGRTSSKNDFLGGQADGRMGLIRCKTHESSPREKRKKKRREKTTTTTTTTR